MGFLMCLGPDERITSLSLPLLSVKWKRRMRKPKSTNLRTGVHAGVGPRGT